MALSFALISFASAASATFASSSFTFFDISASLCSSALAAFVAASFSFFVAASAASFHLLTSALLSRTAFSASFFFSSSSFVAFSATALSFAAFSFMLFSSCCIILCCCLSSSLMPSPARSAASRPASTVTVPSLMDASTSTFIARLANSSVLSVSFELSCEGDMQTSSDVFEFPPIESSRICVSFESRYGMNFFFSASALTTFPNASKLPLMFTASFSCWPCTPLFLMRSLPARSTIVSFPIVMRIFVPVWLLSMARSRLLTLIWKTAWLRLDALFIFVSA